MCAERIIRRLAGIFILLSVALAVLFHPAWLLFTLLVGVNLVLSSVTNLCPLEIVLGRFRVLGCRPRP